MAICDSRVVLRNGNFDKQVLVQWDGRSPEEATWEWMTDFKDTYPSYNLEDKVSFEGEENVTPMDDSGLGRGKRSRKAPGWHEQFVMG